MAGRPIVLVFSICFAVAAGAARLDRDSPRPAPGARPDSTRAILIGMEYALIDNPSRVRRLARELAPIGAPAVKHYAEHIEWGAMQRGPQAAIDFRRSDSYVREFQAAGFTDLVMCLRSASSWGSKSASLLRTTNPTPKPQYLPHYEGWIAAMVERYDGDGRGDMPGLKRPVRYYEIGSEFSTYEPEPVEEYLAMLERAYRVAHAAYSEVIIAHAAFLVTGAFAGDPTPGQYVQSFGAVDRRIMHHDLAAIRKILDRGDLFDVLNIHSLGDPREIEAHVRWLRYEMELRGYRKPIIISDTASTPFIAWGAATDCNQPASRMGIIIPPAREEDRCRLAAYFTRLVNADTAVLRWTHMFVAEDLVKRVVISADQDIALINTAFIEDLGWFKLKFFKAGTGPSAWAGMVDLDRREHRPAYYALQRTVTAVRGYRSIRRIPLQDGSVRLYEVDSPTGKRWIGWLDPDRVVLPGETVPEREVRLPLDPRNLTVETMVPAAGPAISRAPLGTRNGVVYLRFTPSPVLISTTPP